jgi:GTP diphosphokinase / guanosine-3',5'-bis(diphosphate) 3'-diphosphatase
MSLEPPKAADPKDPYGFEKLKKTVEEYFPEADFTLLDKAFDLSLKNHDGQMRSSGEPYIIHPIAVCQILAEMRMDLDTIVTGVLHDTVEDTDTTLEDIKKDFGDTVAQLVDGVTKLSRITFKTNHEKQAENFRKMVLAMAKDLRVIIVKLADRTHNMRTLQHLAPVKQQRIAQETLDIYAPLANRLGISWMKTELEDLSLRYIKPEVYYKLANLVSMKKRERDEYIQKLIKIITDKTEEYGLTVRVTGRAKHFYSIFKKMEAQKINFEEVPDLVAFRMITKDIGQCYEVLGIIHSFFKPVPGRFKDYIAMPKNNMYQSLHTTVIGPFGERLEIQIRTEDMHRVAESGIAAHWEYKDGKLLEKDKVKFHWLRQLVDAQENLESPQEFLESVKLDLFMGDIYVFTPKGELLEFPMGATPLDFAYTIHTGLGHKTTGAKVNGRIVPLKHKLRSGDTVEIITSPHQKPNKDWLKLVKTSRAKSKIRVYIRTEARERAKEIGYDLLDREFRKVDESLSKFEKRKDLNEVAGKLSFASFDEMLISVGYSKVEPEKVIAKLFPEKVKAADKEEKDKTIAEIQGSSESVVRTGNGKSRATVVKVAGIDDDVLVRFGKCCSPLPGDDIIGYISRGRGITVHRIDCERVLDLDPNRGIDVTWSDNAESSTHEIKIKVICNDESGILNSMSKIITDSGINIKSVNIKVNPDKKATGLFDLEVKTKGQINACIQQLESLKGIILVERV